MVLRVHGMDEAGVRFSVGPLGTLSSVVERSLHTGKAVGSIPTECTRFRPRLRRTSRGLWSSGMTRRSQ